MTLETARALMDELNIDVAVERVGENDLLPADWHDGADHYRLALSRPGAREALFSFSAIGIDNPDGALMLFGMAAQMQLYTLHPRAQDWCAVVGVPLETVIDTWYTFADDERTLMAFFGERYPDFLAVGSED